MQLLSLPLSAFEESILHSYVSKPPTALPVDALPLLQDLVCVRLIQLGRYVDAIRMDREFASSKVGTSTRQAQERSKMVQDLYDALPVVERAFVDTELAIKAPRGKPERPRYKTPPREDVDMNQSWEENRPSDVHSSASKLPISRPIPERANAPRFGGPIPTLPSVPTVLQLPTVPSHPSGRPTASRSSFPLPTLPTTFSSPSGSRPRHSLSNTAGRLALGTLPHISSPLSGAKFPIPAASQTTKSSGKIFFSANQQSNAFYTPPQKVQGHSQPLFPPAEQPSTNGHAQIIEPEKVDEEPPIDEEDKAEEEAGAPEPEPQEQQQQGQKQDLGFSLFGSDIQSWMNVESGSVVEPAEKSLSLSTSVKRKVPGSFGDDEDEDMEEDVPRKGKPQEEEEEAEEVVTSRTARSKQSVSARSTASRGHKKARSKRTESKDAKRRRPSPQHNLPGALDDEDAEDDQVAPLPSTKIPVRKSTTANTGRLSRGSTASDLADELGEGVQTRRRSSRLSTSVSGLNVGEPDVSPKKSSARIRKPTTKTSASGTRKKRS